MSEYIERGALLALLEERRDFLFKENGDYDHYSNGFDEAVDKVENFPVAADVVKVKHGRWIVDEADSGEVGGYPAYIEFHCPVCNEPYSLESGQYDWFYGDDIPFKFCHECGCKMDGGTDNE